MIHPIDFHSHSIFSLDSDTPTESMVQAAIKKNISHFCITEHKDTDYYYEDIAYYKDEPFSREISRLKSKYGDKINLYKGVEIDCQKMTLADADNFIKTYSFDFVIASVHVLKHRFFDTSYFQDNDAQESYREYLEEQLELSRQDFFDVMGHIDYVKRFGSEFLKFDPLKYEDKIRMILSNIINNGKGIELNTGGLRHSHGETYPSETILRWYREMGGEIITTGSDAHIPEHVGYELQKGMEFLKDIGFEGIWIFKSRKPEKIAF